jgi:hypothetical protein
LGILVHKEQVTEPAAKSKPYSVPEVHEEHRDLLEQVAQLGIKVEQRVHILANVSTVDYNMEFVSHLEHNELVQVRQLGILVHKEQATEPASKSKPYSVPEVHEEHNELVQVRQLGILVHKGQVTKPAIKSNPY